MVFYWESHLTNTDHISALADSIASGIFQFERFWGKELGFSMFTVLTNTIVTAQTCALQHVGTAEKPQFPPTSVLAQW